MGYSSQGNAARRAAQIVRALFPYVFLQRAGALLLALVALLVFASSAHAQILTQTDILGPIGGEFGKQVVVLPNGNFVVTDPGYDAGVGAGTVLNVGAVDLL